MLVKMTIEVLKPFVIIMLLSVVQQFSGMSVLRAYVVNIFNKVFEESNTRLVNGTLEGKNDMTLL